MKIHDLKKTAIQNIASDTARLDVDLLLCHALSCSRSYLIAHADDELSEEQEAAALALLDRRVQGEPVAYILGEKEFWGLSFKVNQSTLIPRPDTELLVEKALGFIKDGGCVLDLGAGSGAIACAIAHECPNAEVIAVDQSTEALSVAKGNAERLDLKNVSFLESNWYDALSSETFDVIVSNPPYVKSEDPHLNEGDVRFEPMTALASGKDGLDDIRVIVEGAKMHLKPGGVLLFEHGYDQQELIRDAFPSLSLEFFQDLGEQPRVCKVCYDENRD